MMISKLGRTLVTAVLPLLALAGPAAAEDAHTLLSVDGMTCGGCVASVKLQLSRTEGVTEYEVSLADGQARVSYDPEQTDPRTIAASVSKTGFQARVEAARGEPEASR